MATDKYRIDILRNLNELRTKEDFCDVTVEVVGMKYRCHRAVLASVSEYFYRLFTSDLWVGGSGETILENVTVETFEIVLKYAYSGVLYITNENAFDLLKIGDYLRMNSFLEGCVEYIEKNPLVLHSLDICLYAFHHLEKPDFARSVARILAPNFEEIAKTDKFLDISFDTLMAVFEEVKRLEPPCITCWHTLRAHANSQYVDCSCCNEAGYESSKPPRSFSRRSHLRNTQENKSPKKGPELNDIFSHLMKWMNHDLINRKKYFRQLALLANIPTVHVEAWETSLNCLENHYLSIMQRDYSKTALTPSCNSS